MIENFTTYHCDNPDAYLTVGAASATWNHLPRNIGADTRLYKDFGANYFSGDFNHRIKITLPTSGDSVVGSWVYFYLLCKDIAAPATLEQAGEDYVGLFLINQTGPSPEIYLRISANGTPADDISAVLTFGVTYYVSVSRDDNGGSHETGQVVARICTGNYYLESGYTLVDTLSLDCGIGEQNDYRYLVATITRNDMPADPSYATSGKIEDLDLAAPAENVIGPVSRPVELYTITKGGTTWWLCNSVDTVTIVHPFIPVAITRGDITDGQEPLDITLPASHAFPASCKSFAPGSTVVVTIQWLDRDDDPRSLRVIYKGMVKSIKFSDDEQKATLHLESIVSSFDKETPEDTFSPQCQAFLFDDRCRVDKDHKTGGVYDFQYSAEVTVVCGNTITVSGLGNTKGAGWALPGYVAYGTEDYRQILAQAGDVLTLILPFSVDMVGKVVTVYAGCDHSIAMCVAKFDNLNNFRGCPYVPTKNIFLTGLY